jgi:hypothetical protein
MEVNMMNRVLGVFKLDPRVYEEIEHDPNATSQAILIVGIVAILSAIGSGLGATIGRGQFGSSFLAILIWTFVGWFIWSLVSYFVGTALFHGEGTLSGMLRVVGFAYAPQLLAIIPCIGAVIGWIWSLATGFVAVRQGLNLDNLRAFLTILVGFLVYVIGSAIIGIFLAPITGILNLGR